MNSGSIPAASTKSQQTVEQTESTGAVKGADWPPGLPAIEPPEAPGVYALAGVPGYIKIGKASKSIVYRMNQLQTGHPVPLRLLAVLTPVLGWEAYIHLRWRHLRSTREWFRADEELIAWVAERRANPDDSVRRSLSVIGMRFGTLGKYREPTSPSDIRQRRDIIALDQQERTWLATRRAPQGGRA